jgi:hypothetical protein
VSLKFSKGNHQYRLDGKHVRGVTTLIGKGLPKEALPPWAARTVAEWVADNPEGVEQLREMGRGPMVNALKGMPWEKRDTAAVRGTDVHALAEKVVHGEEVDVPGNLVGHVEGYARFLDRFQVEALHTEMPIANRSAWYAGTFDIILRFGAGPWKGRTIMGDNKTSNGIYGDTGLQLAGYARAEFMAPEPETELPLPELDGAGVIHITDAGSTFYPYLHTPADIDAAFRVFRHVAYVAGKRDYIDALKGTPFDEPEE